MAAVHRIYPGGPRSLRSRRFAAPAIVLTLLLGACTQLNLPPLFETGPAAKSGPTAASRAKQTPATGDTEKRQQNARRSPPRLPDLSGLSPGHMQALLGEPAMRRLDKPSQHWRYDHKDCALHVYFYEQGGRYRVNYIDARRPRIAGQAAVPAKVDAQTCVREIWQAGPNGPAAGKSS